MTIGDALGYYEVLEVHPEAGSETIKQQYHVLAKKWHPDRNTDEKSGEIFQKISVAYNTLKDDDSRLLYDILSQAYDEKHFPDMNGLKIYTNQAGYEEIDLRNIKLTQIIGKLVKHQEIKHAEICNYAEARKLAFKVSIKNWLLGWWSLTGIIANIKAISENYFKVLSDYKGNFTLLVHNMLAYNQENRYDEAYASARLALRYATPRQKQLIEQYMEKIPYQRDYLYPQWKATSFKMVQLVAPLCLIISILLVLSTRVVDMKEFNRIWASDNNINYFHEVRFRGGESTVDDIVVAKVVSIPVDTEDMSQLYHLKSDSKIMYGPDKNFDVLTELSADTTVRFTGFTPDEKWARVMIDNGEMGFVPYKDIKQGIGKEIPEFSKIYTGTSF